MKVRDLVRAVTLEGAMLVRHGTTERRIRAPSARPGLLEQLLEHAGTERLQNCEKEGEMVEHDTFNVGVAGPIPASPTTA